MVKKTVTRNLKFRFGIGLFILFTISIASCLSILNLLKTNALVAHSNLIMQKLEKIVSVMKDAETGQRGFLLTNQQEFLQPYNGSNQKAIDLVNQVQSLTKGNNQQQINVTDIKVILLERIAILDQLLNQKNHNEIVTIDGLRKGKQAMDALRSSIDKAEAAEQALLQTRVNTLQQYIAVTPFIILLAALLATAASLFSYFKIMVEIKKKEGLQEALKIKVYETDSKDEQLAVAGKGMTAINEQHIASEKRFRDMMESIPQLAWTNNINGEVDFYNQRWFDYTGLNLEESKARGWNEVMHPDDLQSCLKWYNSIIKSGTGGEYEVREKRKDGIYRWHLIRMMPILNDENKTHLWVGTATDIDELKQLQQQKDDFINVASHELKTPFTALKASLQILYTMQDNNLSPLMLLNLVERANKSMNKVSTLIDNLLDVSKFTQGQLHLNKTWFILARLIGESCSDLLADGAYMIITTGDIDLQVYADAERIDQVVINFVNNAIKYAPGSKEIRIHIEKLQNMAKISVIDKGKGISPDKLPHLFDKYYQSDNTGIQYAGLGLGLFISSEIIKRHHGEIGADSEFEKGSSFWFTLPL